MKKNSFLIFLFLLSLIFIIIYFKLYLRLQESQIKIIRNFLKSLKALNEYKWLWFSFCYGILHSIGPGHGKVFLIRLSLDYNRKFLIFYAAMISYIQGILSYILIKYIFPSAKTLNSFQLKKIDKFSIIIYGGSLIFLVIYEILHKLLEKKGHTCFFLLGTFLPCSGVISILLVTKVLEKNELLFSVTVAMSSGMFFTLGIFSLFIESLRERFLLYNKKNYKYLAITIYIFLFFIGIYKILMTL